MKLTGRFSDIFDPHRGEAVPPVLIGATIKRIGAPLKCPSGVEGGGLVIDYVPKGKRQLRRVILSFNEIAMWVESDSAVPAASSLD